MATGRFLSLDLGTLQTMLQQWQTCLTAIALNQSYSMAGRTFTRADLEVVSSTVDDLSTAVQFKSGQLIRFTRADMS